VTEIAGLQTGFSSKLHVFGIASFIVFTNVVNHYAFFHHHSHSLLSSLKSGLLVSTVLSRMLAWTPLILSLARAASFYPPSAPCFTQCFSHLSPNLQPIPLAAQAPFAVTTASRALWVEPQAGELCLTVDASRSTSASFRKSRQRHSANAQLLGPIRPRGLPQTRPPRLQLPIPP
jgi:hypothetical protein